MHTPLVSIIEGKQSAQGILLLLYVVVSFIDFMHFNSLAVQLICCYGGAGVGNSVHAACSHCLPHHKRWPSRNICGRHSTSSKNATNRVY